MKTILSIALVGAFLSASSPAAKAFTFDFSGVANGALPVSVNVAGYGNVTFTLLSGTAVVGEALGTKTVQMSPASTILVAFPTVVTGATFTFIDLDGSNEPNDQVSVTGNVVVSATGVLADINDATANVAAQVITPQVNSNNLGQITISLNDQSIAGLRAVSFDAQAIPEPSTALLAGIGAIAMLARRRR